MCISIDLAEPESVTHAQWLHEQLVSNHAAILQLATTQPHQSRRDGNDDAIDDASVMTSFAKFLNKTISRCEKFWFLDYNAYESMFSFQCVSTAAPQVGFGEPSPFLVLPHIFLGSRMFDPTTEALSQLGITHVITHDPAMQNGLLPSVIKGQFEISFFIASIRDEDAPESAEEMELCWETCMPIIATAITVGNVLVQLHGRSRSASAILAWLIYSTHCTYEEALQTMIQTIPASKLDLNYVCAEQLQHWAAITRQRQVPFI